MLNVFVAIAAVGTAVVAAVGELELEGYDFVEHCVKFVETVIPVLC